MDPTFKIQPDPAKKALIDRKRCSANSGSYQEVLKFLTFSRAQCVLRFVYLASFVTLGLVGPLKVCFTTWIFFLRTLKIKPCSWHVRRYFSKF